MKRCTTCNRTYTDTSLNFCLEDGTPLTVDAGPAMDPNATIRYTSPLETNPPRTEVYQQQTPLLNQVDASAQPRQWSPSLTPTSRKKSGAIWWIIGGVLVVGIIGIGIVIMILALARLGSNSNSNANSNANRNTNSRIANRNANSSDNSSSTNSSSGLPPAITDDFSQKTWGTGNFTFGDIWYDNDEYHMRAKEQSYLVMYAPADNYNTADATVRVTARSVDGSPASSGFGLIVHGEKSKGGELEDYALLIYPGSEPQYEIIKHKGGTQTTVVPWTKSRVIRTGTSPNRLEVRARGLELTFYINSQYVDRITDAENFKRGVAGLYTSGTTEVAFDDLEIKR